MPCNVMEQVKLQRRIKELEGENAELKDDVNDLLEQLANTALGKERPSPPDILKQSGIRVKAGPGGPRSIVEVDLSETNIPWTKTPSYLPIMGIPDTNSMDGLFDYGNDNLYIQAADEANHQIMVEWIAAQWIASGGMLAADCVYRIMVNEADAPGDFSKPDKWYAIHRVIEVGVDDKGRYFRFAGINNLSQDPFLARDRDILYLNVGTVN